MKNKQFFKAWCSVSLVAALGMGTILSHTAFADTEDSVASGSPETLVTENIALGKEFTFRKLSDMNEVMTMYNYFPDNAGIDGTSCYDIATRGNVMTDGQKYEWMGYSVNSTYANTVGWAFVDLGESYTLDKVVIYQLAAWLFRDVVVQISNDSTFQTGVTTVFSSVETLKDGETVVYDGGRVNCSEETASETGWLAANPNYIQSYQQSTGNIFKFSPMQGRYVRICNSNEGNGGAANCNTNFVEIEVYGATKGLYAPQASKAAGVYEAIDSVELTTPYANAEIRYTLDGSYPTKESILYEGAIDFTNAESSTLLRAVTFVDGKQSRCADYQYKFSNVYENKALGKEVTFRKLSDMSEVLTMYSYYPDGLGYESTGVRDLISNNITDGLKGTFAPWYVNSTYAHTVGWAFVDLGREYEIDRVEIDLLSWWSFFDVVIQVSNDPMFETGVTTVFSASAELKDGDVTVFEGGYINCTGDNMAATGWNGYSNVVNSQQAYGTMNVFEFSAVKARYVRITNSNGASIADANTNFTEIEVYGGDKNALQPDEIPDVEAEQVIYEIKNNTKTLDVLFATEKADVTAQLPETLSATLSDGTAVEYAVEWNCENYDGEKAGAYTFLPTITEADAATDLYELLNGASVTVNVATPADKTALNAAIESAEALDETDYTAVSFAPVKEALTEAKAVAADKQVAQKVVDEAEKKLTDAQSALVLRAKDKTELKAEIDGAKALDKTLYLTTGHAALDKALTEAEEVYADDQAALQAAEKVLAALKEAVGKLERKADTANISALLETVKAADYKADDYTEATFAALEDAVEEAEAAVAGEVNEADAERIYNALDEAVKGLQAYGSADELNALIEEVKALKAEDYVKQGYDALQEELTAAEEVAALQKQFQPVYDEAKTSLEAKKDALISLVPLKTAIAEAKEITGDEYTELSFAELTAAIEEAEQTLALDNATKADLDGAIAKIDEAKAGLTEKPEEPVTPPDSSSENSSNDSSESSNKQSGNVSEIDSGCGSILGGIGGIGAAVALGFALMKKKKED